MPRLLWKILDIPTFEDERGILSVLEDSKNVPFRIQRVYYIYKAQQENVRGFHAHKKLKQFLVALSGSVEIELNDSNNKEKIILNSPFEGLYVDSPVWRTLKNFKHNAILLVLASEPYTQSDYIRKYDDFLDYVSESNK